MRPVSFCSTLLLALAISSPALAGEELACNLRFAVRDAQTLEPIRAEITVRDSRHGWTRTKTANASGLSKFAGVRADSDGSQDIKVSAAGYTPQSFKGVKCPLAQTIRGRIQLERAL